MNTGEIQGAFLVFEKYGLLVVLLLPFLGEFLLGAWLNSRRGIYFDDLGLYHRKPNQIVFKHPANNVGFWGDDLALEKPNNGLRVFLITELCPMSMRVPRMSQAMLAEALPNRRVRVNTVSAPRYTSHHALMLLKGHLLKFEPDVVVLTLGLRDNFFNTMPFQDRSDFPGIYDPFDLRTVFGLKLFRYHLIDKPFRAQPDFGASEIRSRENFQKNVDEMLEFLRHHGVPAILMKYPVAFPTEDQSLISRMEPMHRGLAHAWGSIRSAQLGIQAHSEILERLAAKYGVPLADPKTVLPGTSVYFKSFNALTAHGRETYGRFISDTVLRSVNFGTRTSSASVQSGDQKKAQTDPRLGK